MTVNLDGTELSAKNLSFDEKPSNGSLDRGLFNWLFQAAFIDRKNPRKHALSEKSA
jgi:hypothetical protein